MDHEIEMKALTDAVNVLMQAQVKLADWYGPEGMKLTRAYEYLRKQLRPMVEEILADPEKGSLRSSDAGRR
jgi:hypothetical protein